MHPFDQAILLTAVGSGTFNGNTSEAYWNFGGPFGGVTAAILLRAVLDHEDRIGEPCSITINYTARISAGPFTVTARTVRTGRSIQHWYVELRQSDIIAANATVVCARRETTWRHQPAVRPAAPPPASIAPMRTDGRNAFVQQFEFRFVEGALDLNPRFDGNLRSARTCVWLNHAVARPWDLTGLAALSDLFFGRIFHVQGTVFPVATVSLTAYFFAGVEHLSSLGSTPLLGIADANIFEAGFFDQSAQLWSSDGRLLATTTQIVTYRA